MHAADQSTQVTFALADDTAGATAIAKFLLDYDLDR